MSASITLVLSPLRGEIPKNLASWSEAWARRARAPSHTRIRAGALFWTLQRISDLDLRSLFGMLRGTYRVGVVLEDPTPGPSPRPLPPRTPRRSNPRH